MRCWETNDMGWAPHTDDFPRPQGVIRRGEVEPLADAASFATDKDGKPVYVLKRPVHISDEDLKRARDAWHDIRGNMARCTVLEEGMSLESLAGGESAAGIPTHHKASAKTIEDARQRFYDKHVVWPFPCREVAALVGVVVYAALVWWFAKAV